MQVKHHYQSQSQKYHHQLMGLDSVDLQVATAETLEVA
jgi:hypothetical protein